MTVNKKDFSATSTGMLEVEVEVQPTVIAAANSGELLSESDCPAIFDCVQIK